MIIFEIVCKRFCLPIKVEAYRQDLTISRIVAVMLHIYIRSVMLGVMIQKRDAVKHPFCLFYIK